MPKAQICFSSSYFQATCRTESDTRERERSRKEGAEQKTGKTKTTPPPHWLSSEAEDWISLIRSVVCMDTAVVDTAGLGLRRCARWWSPFRLLHSWIRKWMRMRWWAGRYHSPPVTSHLRPRGPKRCWWAEGAGGPIVSSRGRDSKAKENVSACGAARPAKPASPLRQTSWNSRPSWTSG